MTIYIKHLIGWGLWQASWWIWYVRYLPSCILIALVFFLSESLFLSLFLHSFTFPSLSIALSIYLSSFLYLYLSSSLVISPLSLSCTSLNFNLSASLKQPMKNFLSLRGKCPKALMPVYLKKAQGIDESYSIPNFYIILFSINLFTSILKLGIPGLLPKGRNTRLYTLNS